MDGLENHFPVLLWGHPRTCYPRRFRLCFPARSEANDLAGIWWHEHWAKPWPWVFMYIKTLLIHLIFHDRHQEFLGFTEISRGQLLSWGKFQHQHHITLLPGGFLSKRRKGLNIGIALVISRIKANDSKHPNVSELWMVEVLLYTSGVKTCLLFQKGTRIYLYQLVRVAWSSNLASPYFKCSQHWDGLLCLSALAVHFSCPMNSQSEKLEKWPAEKLFWPWNTNHPE